MLRLMRMEILKVHCITVCSLVNVVYWFLSGRLVWSQCSAKSLLYDILIEYGLRFAFLTWRFHGCAL